MRNQSAIVFSAVTLLAFASTSPAALILQVESGELASSEADQVGHVEVFFREVEPVTDEDLSGFSLKVDLPMGSANGIRFLPPSMPTDHPYVLPGAPMQVLAVDATSVTVAGELPEASSGVDVTDGAGVLRLAVLFPAASLPGAYPILIDPSLTALQDSSGEEIPYVISPGGGFVFVPEPTAPALLAVAGLSAMRRRHRRARST